MASLPLRRSLSPQDWAVVRRIYRRVFWDGRDPNGIRTTWALWISGLLGAFVAYEYRFSLAGAVGSLLVLTVGCRACWRAGHQEGYDAGFDEGFERGWLGARGIDWTREDLYDD